MYSSRFKPIDVYNSCVMTAIGGIIAIAVLWECVSCGIVNRLNGTYEGFRPYTVAPGNDPVVARQAARVTLIVKPNGQAELSDGGLPAEGHMDYGSSSATFIPEAVAGVGVHKQPREVADRLTASLKPQPDGSWLYNGSVILKRKG